MLLLGENPRRLVRPVPFHNCPFHSGSAASHHYFPKEKLKNNSSVISGDAHREVIFPQNYEFLKRSHRRNFHSTTQRQNEAKSKLWPQQKSDSQEIQFFYYVDSKRTKTVTPQISKSPFVSLLTSASTTSRLPI